MISKWEEPNRSTPGEEAWRPAFGKGFSEHDSELRRLVHRRLGDRVQGSEPSKPLLREACEHLYGDAAKADGERWLTTARALRRVLVSEARRSIGDVKAARRGVCRGAGNRAPEILAVDRGLRALESLRPDLARLVELRYYGGLPTEQVAEILAVPRDSLAAGWRVVRLYLRRWVREAVV
jgi:DNA-directed RNA polymerase specialized sigma24 family protein